MNDRYTMRSDLLQEADRIISNDRNKSYGEPDEDFQRIAAIASAMGFRIDSGGGEIRELRGADVAKFMIALKISRLMWSETHRDSWLDIAGYAGCGFETAKLQAERADGALFTASTKPTEDVDSTRLTADVQGMADKAIAGDPTELEAAGLFLKDARPDRITCWSVCAETTIWKHTYAGGCKYRVTRRRIDG